MYGKILIVDDAATNRIVMKVKLSAAFHETVQARSGAEALRLVQTHAPDLAIIGATLPDMTPCALIAAMRRLALGRSMPVVMIAAPGDGGARLQALEAGADDCLHRPFDDGLLLARVRNLLRAREAGPGFDPRGDGAGLTGVAEPAQSYDVAGRIGLVAARSETALRWRAALAPHLSDRLDIVSREEALAEAGAEGCDLYIIAAELGTDQSGLRLMSELRARARTRHAAVCIVMADRRPEAAITAFDLGANDILPEGFEGREAALRARALLRRKHAADRHRAAVRRGLELALTDPLTGLHNRRFALPRLARLLEGAAESRSACAVMAIDIDRFKTVNDTWGHAAGDAVLTEVARRIATTLEGASLVARIGGEEFLAALVDIAPAAAVRLAEELCETVRATPVAVPGGGVVSVSISIGLALGMPEAEPAAESMEAVLDRADRALLVAKAAGRNKVTISRSAA